MIETTYGIGRQTQTFIRIVQFLSIFCNAAEFNIRGAQAIASYSSSVRARIKPSNPQWYILKEVVPDRRTREMPPAHAPALYGKFLELMIFGAKIKIIPEPLPIIGAERERNRIFFKVGVKLF